MQCDLARERFEVAVVAATLAAFCHEHDLVWQGTALEAAIRLLSHLGLRSMRERAEAVGATFTLDSALRSGTTIRVGIPLG